MSFVLLLPQPQPDFTPGQLTGTKCCDNIAAQLFCYSDTVPIPCYRLCRGLATLRVPPLPSSNADCPLSWINARAYKAKQQPYSSCQSHLKSLREQSWATAVVFSGTATSSVSCSEAQSLEPIHPLLPELRLAARTGKGPFGAALLASPGPARNAPETPMPCAAPAGHPGAGYTRRHRGALAPGRAGGAPRPEHAQWRRPPGPRLCPGLALPERRRPAGGRCLPGRRRGLAMGSRGSDGAGPPGGGEGRCGGGTGRDGSRQPERGCCVPCRQVLPLCLP